MKFLSSEVALCLYKSTMLPITKYCRHVWVGAPSCFLEMLDKLQKRICRTVDPSLAASLEPLTHRQNVVNLSLFIGITLVDVHLKWLKLVSLPYSREKSTCYSDRLPWFFCHHS